MEIELDYEQCPLGVGSDLVDAGRVVRGLHVSEMIFVSTSVHHALILQAHR